MAHYAQVIDGMVAQVIVAGQEFIDSLPDPERWIQTSYNTLGGVHHGLDGLPDGGTPLRKNFAGIGYSYSAVLDAFIPPSPFPSWELDTDTCLWRAPVPMPGDGRPYVWDEAALAWLETGAGGSGPGGA